jgi:probable blue pigment (indigoidine) exporter
MSEKTKHFKFLLWGLVFSIFWSSASVAAKIGVQSMEPLVLFQFRFLFAGFLLLVYSYFFENWRLPTRKEFVALLIFGVLNITLYLSLFVLAINEVAAGIGSLSTSMGPLLMTILSGLMLGTKTKAIHYLALFLGLCGVTVAVCPLLAHSFATPRGLAFLLGSMLSYSAGSIYFSQIKWTLPRLAINGWQVCLGGLCMLPLTLFLKEKPIVFTLQNSLSIAWLVVPVSILAVNIWLRLIRVDAIKASLFLFLCPIFGFLFSSLILHEPFTLHTLAGLGLVLVALFLGQKNKA